MSCSSVTHPCSAAHLVCPNVDAQVVRALRIQVVRMHRDASPSGGNCKRPDASHQINNNLARAKQVRKPEGVAGK